MVLIRLATKITFFRRAKKRAIVLSCPEPAPRTAYSFYHVRPAVDELFPTSLLVRLENHPGESCKSPPLLTLANRMDAGLPCV